MQAQVAQHQRETVTEGERDSCDAQCSASQRLSNDIEGEEASSNARIRGATRVSCVQVRGTARSSDARPSDCYAQRGRSGEKVCDEGYRDRITVNDESASDSSIDQSAPSSTHDKRRHSRGRGFELTPPTRADIAAWIADEWAGLSSSTISGCFKRTGLLLGVRVLDPPLPEMFDSVHTLLNSMVVLAVSARATTGVCFDDDVVTAGESDDSAEDSS